jgi:hypothetical protein
MQIGYSTRKKCVPHPRDVFVFVATVGDKAGYPILAPSLGARVESKKLMRASRERLPHRRWRGL